MLLPAKSSRLPLVGLALGAVVFWLIAASSFFFPRVHDLGRSYLHGGPSLRTQAISRTEADLVAAAAQHFVDFPIRAPYKERFGELGGRLQLVRRWIERVDVAPDDGHARSVVANETERVLAALFPFLVADAQSHASASPLAHLRARIATDERGIVIPTGSKTFRFACHLVAAIRTVLRSNLPIQIVHAGDGDLPRDQREALASLSTEHRIEFLDVQDVFDDELLHLAEGGWAIKAFAALASTFAETIVLDADAVLLQPPEVLFTQQAYSDAGALLFHDRLLWQHGFQDRHQWWHRQIADPSPALNKSRVWTEEYAEEADSGVVVVDKRRLDILLGLLHVAWQNTKSVRDDVTYKMTYGDKESWWLGLELAGSKYEFEKHYGGIVGWPQNATDGKGGVEVCSFVIAHLDQADQLLWYNGGLLKNKMTQPNTYEVPTHRMVDGTWRKGGRKEDMSCMAGAPATELSAGEVAVLQWTMDLAQEIDRNLRLVQLPAGE